jgi:hypothetical protein
MTADDIAFHATDRPSAVVFVNKGARPPLRNSAATSANSRGTRALLQILRVDTPEIENQGRSGPTRIERGQS